MAVEAAGAVDDHPRLLLPAELHLLEDALCRAQEHLFVGRSVFVHCMCICILIGEGIIMKMKRHGRRAEVVGMISTSYLTRSTAAPSLADSSLYSHPCSAASAKASPVVTCRLVLCVIC